MTFLLLTNKNQCLQTYYLISLPGKIFCRQKRIDIPSSFSTRSSEELQSTVSLQYGVKTLLPKKATFSINNQKLLLKHTSKFNMHLSKYLKGIISVTGVAEGMSMNNEFVKNSNLLLASKFLGILAAESFTVRSKCKRFTCSFCEKTREKSIDCLAMHYQQIQLRIFVQFLALGATVFYQRAFLHFELLLRYSMYQIAL